MTSEVKQNSVVENSNGTANHKNGLPAHLVDKCFPKGVSGNPGGRPKTSYFTDEVKQWLREIDPKDKKSNRTRLNVLMERIAKDKPEIILYYAYGKPVETHEHSGIGGGAIPLADEGPLQSVSSERLRQLAATLFRAAEKQAEVIELNGNGSTHATP